MSRSIEEWRGKTDDTAAPPRVRLRVFERCSGKCHKCGHLIRAGERWILEHLKALINGGENREQNLGLTCSICLPIKNAEDMAEKSAVYQKRSKHLLPSQPKRIWPKRPMRWVAGNVKRLEEL